MLPPPNGDRNEGQGYRYYAEEQPSVHAVARNQNPKQRYRKHRVLGMDVIGDNVVPCQMVPGTGPAPRQTAVLLRWKYLQSTHNGRENHGDCGQPRHPPIGTSVFKDVVEPSSGCRQGQKDRYLMMPAQPCHTNARAAKGRAGPRMHAAHRTQQE